MNNKRREQPHRHEKSAAAKRKCNHSWPALWSSVEGLRPYYSAICNIRWTFEEAQRELGIEIGSGFELCPSPNHYHERTVDGIYLFCNENVNRWDWNKDKLLAHPKTTIWADYLLTPFGKVEVRGACTGHEISAVTMRFLQQLKQRFHVTQVDHLMQVVRGVDEWESQPKLHTGALFRIGGWEGCPRSFTKKIYGMVHDLANKREYEDFEELFSEVSEGRNKFVAIPQ